MNNFLFICVGNICRSPMAEGLFRHARPDNAVLSAGINALVGAPADPLSVFLMREQGIDISTHRARLLAGWMVKEADIVLTMDEYQKRLIEKNYLGSKGKVFRLCESSQDDVPDPYRQDIAVFRQSCNLIGQGVENLLVRLACQGADIGTMA